MIIIGRYFAGRLFASVATLAFTVLLSAPVRAELIHDISTAPYHAIVVADPDAHAVQGFTSMLAGTVSLSATDLRSSMPTLDLLTGMLTNVALIGAGQPLVLSGSGTLEFQVERNQNFTTSLYGLAAGPSGFGMAALDLSFAPRVGEVPLPAGIWMLAAGVALLGARSRRRQASTRATLA